MSFSTHQRIRRNLEEKKRLEELTRNKVEELDFNKMSVPELKEFAEVNNIDISGTAKKADTVAVIEDAVANKLKEKDIQKEDVKVKSSTKNKTETEVNQDSTNTEATK